MDHHRLDDSSSIDPVRLRTEALHYPQQSQKALRDISLHLGIVGALTFTVFVLIFREDWTNRYQYMSYLLPIPVIILLISRRFPGLGGMLSIALGIGAVIFDGLFSPAHPGQIPGRGLVYTVIFVTVPLLASGLVSIRRWRKYS